jgi:SAM-dependent methyltransferase
MSHFTDADHVRRQYSSSDRLAARIRLHAQFSTNPVGHTYAIFEQVVLAAGDKPDAVIYEFGAGHGDLWVNNADRIPVGWQVTLTDLSSGMLEDCRRLIGAVLTERINTQMADVQDIPFPDSSADVCIANFMLYHVPDWARAVRELRRVLKSGGMLIAAINGDNHLLELFQLADLFEQGAGLTPKGHVDVFRSGFSLQNGAALLQQEFDNVRLIRLENALRITELQPLLDYIASTVDDADFIMNHPGNRAQIEALDARIQRDGAIDVPKDTGVFLAS